MLTPWRMAMLTETVVSWCTPAEDSLEVPTPNNTCGYIPLQVVVGIVPLVWQ